MELKSKLALKAKREFDDVRKLYPNADILRYEIEVLSLVDKYGSRAEFGNAIQYTALCLPNAIRDLLNGDSLLYFKTKQSKQLNLQ